MSPDSHLHQGEPVPESGPLAARDGLPRRGALGDSTERLCGRQMTGSDGVVDGLCGKPATVHIIWEDKETYIEHGFACAEHSDEIRELWKPFATHPVGACCAMPGSIYHVPPVNECRFEGLDTTEPVRAVVEWLMGFPREWTVCALSGTRLSRRSRSGSATESSSGKAA